MRETFAHSTVQWRRRAAAIERALTRARAARAGCPGPSGAPARRAPQATEPPIPYGSPKTCTTYAAFLAKLALEAKHKGVAEGKPLPQSVWAELNGRANRLRWILDCTMGSQGDFERRRTELAIIGGCEPSAITDDAVVASYLDSVRSGGVMLEYLQHGVLAVGIDSTLYVHGGLVAVSYSQAGEKFVTQAAQVYAGDVLTEGAFEVALGCVPGQPGREPDVGAWMRKLNAWLQLAVSASISSPPKQPHAAFGQQYCAYGAPPPPPRARRARLPNPPHRPRRTARPPLARPPPPRGRAQARGRV